MTWNSLPPSSLSAYKIDLVARDILRLLSEHLKYGHLLDYQGKWPYLRCQMYFLTVFGVFTYAFVFLYTPTSFCIKRHYMTFLIQQMSILKKLVCTLISDVWIYVFTCLYVFAILQCFTMFI